MESSKVWYWAHLGATIALAVLSLVSIVLFAAERDLPPVNSFGGVIIFAFVVPGTLLVFAINHLILWRRRPRVIRTSDKVVVVIVAVLIVLAMLSTIDEEFGFGAVFIVVPLIMIAGVISTVVIAVNTMRAATLAQPVGPVEPGTTPVAATLDQLFPESPGADPDAPPTPYGPKG